MLEHLTLQPQHVGTPLETLFYGFLLDREASRCTPKTLEHYQYTCGTFVEWLHAHGVSDAGRIASHHIRAYLISLQRRGLKDTTQHAHARGIRAWLNWLVREGDLGESPMRNVAMPRLEMRIPSPFSLDDIRSLLEACDRHTALGVRNWAIVLTLLDTGLRATEFVSLRVGDVDMRSGLTTIMGKGQKQRTVRVGSRARAAILRLLAFRQEVRNEEPLWSTASGNLGGPGSLARHGLQTMLRRLGISAGVVPCGPHRFRRTFALWCLRDGMDLHSLRMLMGHSSLTSCSATWPWPVRTSSARTPPTARWISYWAGEGALAIFEGVEERVHWMGTCLA